MIPLRSAFCFLFVGLMQSYEAIRWALDRLNKKNTILNGEFLSDSYVPGVKLGNAKFYSSAPKQTLQSDL